MHVLKTANLTKDYGNHQGIFDVDLEIDQGEIFGFIGPNGAGKSTTIRLLMQLNAPTRGEIHLFGQRVIGDRADLRKRIGYLPSEIHFYPDMTGKQALELAAAAYGLSLKNTRAAVYAERLQWDMSSKIRTYSLGNRKKMGIVLALLHEPELFILDEPTSGLDPLVQHSFFELLSELKKQRGMTVFFSTHVLNEVEKICERVAFIREGKILRTSKVSELSEPGDHVVVVGFQESGDLRLRYGLNQLDGSVTYDGTHHHLRTGRRLNEVLAKLALLPIQDVMIRKPTVEELFMAYYRDEVKQ
ncbi:ABC-2 type transport system ATP-binding protein [Paenibacillus sp. yr247]|uniref:ABC transporter ATP-binding protein n=1 Tax=Paenibacillus sp. yr247 TaxID=1761880 RepID=UPI0008923EF3|nr:ABC transporter ATP-binding protein [Paenibacillus sp. yr247]SDN53448.1 ABC-2 type transport system ATP-binding protein [Paenibacillus sp. yr247]